MGKLYTLELDSSERDVTLYPNINDYTVELNRPLYNISTIKLNNVCIPKTQHLINDGNRYLHIGEGNVVSLATGTWSTGESLASNLTDQLVNFDGSLNNIVVTYSPNTSSFTFTSSVDFIFNFGEGEGPADVLGFNYTNISSTGGSLTGGYINLNGPTSLIIRITNGSDDLQQDVYVSDMYTGRLMIGNLNIGDVLYTGTSDDTITHTFYKRNETITYLRLRFYYNNGPKLIPYDFGNRNHMLKFVFDCNLDKLEVTEKVSKDFDKLPDPVKLNMYGLRNDKIFVYVLVVLLIVGLVSILKR